MSDMQNFIEPPHEAQGFVPRIIQSLKTSRAFLVDQRWASLLFLLVYVGLVAWDQYSARLLPTPPAPEWTSGWPDFLDPLKIQIAREGLNTWRSILASLVTLLFWGNALLYIADRSAAFPDAEVVGLGRYIVRASMIALLLLVPLGIGLVLLVIPGLLVAGILVSAATITIFRSHGIFRAIGEAYRLVTQSLPGQNRVFGFSRSFIHITGAYALVMALAFVFALSTIFLAAGLSVLAPALAFPLYSLQTVLSELVGSFLNLSFSIFVLRLYSEYRTLLWR
ncbi:MAG TPA: hypothetical protein VFO10_07825 [Oligoflexus sp.]|uniref:hypothetical protein n=1 Tax=Oligoflexus sp. TaxID=1971216 RepID=UPI002D7FF29F|nr:hypothetical protein [Oligoflexus sp.]HET9237143.1 hypothetical protein [Oligoflexus sp.]